MDLVQLRYFVVVAHLEHFTKAAEQLHVSQPALSKIISRLEEELDTRLFDRTNAGVTLNEYGKLFLSRVENSLRQLDAGRNELLALKGKRRNTVNVVTDSPELPGDQVRSFLQSHPDVSLHHRQLDQDEIITALITEQADFAIMVCPADRKGLAFESVLEDEMLLSVPQNSPLSSLNEISIMDIADQSFMKKNTGDDIIYRCFAAYGLQPNLVYEGFNSEPIGDLVMAGYALSFINATDYYPFQIAYNGLPNCKILRIREPECRFHVGMATKYGCTLTQEAQHLYTALRDYLKELGDQLKKLLSEMQ